MEASTPAGLGSGEALLALMAKTLQPGERGTQNPCAVP